MLHFIIGTAGTGKTDSLFRKIEDTARQGRQAILLVPEQLSFESEKRLHRALGPRLSLQVEVLSFTRLCNSIFRALGGLADRPVSPAAKYLLMSVAVEELRDSLAIYRKSMGNASFLQTLVEACGEFKAAGVRPGRLAEAAADCGGRLGEKLAELSGIYGAYQALLEQGYSDGDDDLIRACALLESNDYFAGCRVFVDGFTTFMAAEFELLGHVVAQAEDVWFALTCDRLADDQKGMGVFSPVKEAAARLRRMAERDGIPVGEPEVHAAPLRYREEALAFVAERFLRPGAETLEGEPEGIALCAAPDRYTEVEWVAARIAALVRDKGLRYRQVAVVARETGPYLRALEAVFPRYGIPYFADLPRAAESHPFVAGLFHAVDVVRGNFDPDSVLLLAKSPILGLDAEAVARLENYCYCWDVRGALWLEDFAANPRGLAGPLVEEDTALLADLNETRARLAEPLAALREALATRTGRGFAAGLYDFLQRVGAADNLTAYAGELPQEERTAFLNESAQVWDEVMVILDIFGSVLGKNALKRGRLCELLRLALDTAEVGLPPQTLDQVLVGKADRIRPVELEAVFVIGAVEGEFPAQVGPTGVFSDGERRQMIEAGVEISAPSLQKAVLERFFAYYAVTLPARWLAVSWPKADLNGQELLPSVIVSQLEALLPLLVRRSPEPAELAVGDDAAFALLAREYGRGTVLEATLREYFGGDEGARRDTLARMERARRRPPHQIRNPELARALFGGRMRLSPTRVERYYRCPFHYFAADGLGVKPRRKVEFSPLESGSVIHHVLQVMVQRHGGKGLALLPDKQLREEIAAIIQGYLEERVEAADKLPPRFRYHFTRLTGMLARLLRRIGEEFDQSEFSPAAFELPIRAGEGVEPLRLETADGIRVLVEGVVDRVDVMVKDGRKYIRVVDYKSGAKTFSLADVLYGINMQMLLYLFTIQENGTGDLADAIPAGVLYMPVRERFVSTGRDTADEKVAAEREKQWRMSGLLLEDEDALRGMERDLAGVFIPAKLGKNGLDAGSSLAGREELGMLSRKVRELVVRMAASLSGGRVEAMPTQSSDFEPCAYCDYRAACGFEPGDPVREIARLDREAALKQLEKEETDG